MSPNEVMSALSLNFVHKRIIGAIGGGLTGGIGGAVGGFLGGGSRRPVLQTLDDRPVTVKFSQSLLQKAGTHLSHGHKKQHPGHKFLTSTLADAARAAGLTGGSSLVGGDCPAGLFADPLTGICQFPGSPIDVDLGGGMNVGPGGAVMGRYGAALTPGNMPIQRAVCLSGMQLGDDGLCYNKGSITNRQRMWPRGRKPLLTGGEMRAISVAATAGRRLERTTKRLQKIGLMKKPPSRRKAPSGAHSHA